MIEKEKFRSYTLDEEKKGLKPIVLKINKEERELIDKAKQIIEQPKDSTTVKTLMTLGYISITSKSTSLILATLFKNKRNNQRQGIVEFELT